MHVLVLIADEHKQHHEILNHHIPHEVNQHKWQS